MNTLWTILIVVGSLLILFLLYLLLGWILWLSLKKQENKVMDEFRKIEPFESSRVDLMKETWTYVDERNLPYKKDFRETFEKAYPDISSQDLVARRKAKETLDFGFIYTRKLLEEKGKRTDRANELIKKLKEKQVEGDNAYQAYDKIAVRYNAILSMANVKIVNKMSGKKRKDPAVIF